MALRGGLRTGLQIVPRIPGEILAKMSGRKLSFRVQILQCPNRRAQAPVAQFQQSPLLPHLLHWRIECTKGVENEQEPINSGLDLTGDNRPYKLLLE